MAVASRSTRDDETTAPANPEGRTSAASTSERSNLRTSPVPSSSVSTTSARQSPRRNSTSPTMDGQPSTTTVAELGSASAVSSAVESSVMSWRAWRPSERGSAAFNIRAHNHHSGPTPGWRSIVRRHAVTKPAGSRPNDAMPPAASCTNVIGSAPDDRATKRSRSIGCISMRIPLIRYVGPCGERPCTRCNPRAS